MDVLLDATEIRCVVPSSLVTQSGRYLHYKSIQIFKGPVWVSSHGNVTFLSKLLTGFTSDKECVIRSGLRVPEFDESDY